MYIYLNPSICDKFIKMCHIIQYRITKPCFKIKNNICTRLRPMSRFISSIRVQIQSLFRDFVLKFSLYRNSHNCSKRNILDKSINFEFEAGQRTTNSANLYSSFLA